MRINREDMLELTRRMTPKRNSFTRLAGCYIGKDGEIDGSFNTHFWDLSIKEKEENIKRAKVIPFSETNIQLKGYQFPKESRGQNSMWQLLMGMKACGLKNDALMEVFYDFVREKYQSHQEYAIYVFHDCYDVPVKALDKERLGESEEVYDYLICTICPLIGDYEPGEPECGFLFPTFTNRSSDSLHVAVFDRNPQIRHGEMIDVLGCE